MGEPVSVWPYGKKTLASEGLSRLLIAHGFNVLPSVDRVSSLPEALTERDLLVLMEAEGGGAEHLTIKRIRARSPSAKLVVLSKTFEVGAVLDAFASGADCYLIKDISRESLIASLNLVVSGEKVLPSVFVDNFSPGDRLLEKDHAEFIEEARLSERERQILACISRGYSNKTISSKLEISLDTVKVHVKSVLRKLKVKNRTQAAIHGLGAGIGMRLPEVIVAAISLWSVNHSGWSAVV